MTWHYGAVYDPENEVWEVKEVYDLDRGVLSYCNATPLADSLDGLIGVLEIMQEGAKANRYRLEGETLMKEASHAAE